MSDQEFDVEAWFRRIGHTGASAPTLATLRALIAAHTATIPFENIDVLVGRPPKLDLPSLRAKLIDSGRGGYCFEQNTLLHAGLTALGFRAERLIARVIRGMAPDAPGPATHMLLRVDVAEGAFLADVGFGNQTPTAPLAFVATIEQSTPHETVRLWPVGDEFTLQAKVGDAWQSVYRLSPHPRPPVDFEVANWFTATHPMSPFVSNFIVARPGAGGTRHTMFNGRITTRRPGQSVDRIMIEDDAAFPEALRGRFGLSLSRGDLAEALVTLDRKGMRGVTHPFFV
jgi:N-hydroxyarylamine O-acetyltransferase